MKCIWEGTVNKGRVNVENKRFMKFWTCELQHFAVPVDSSVSTDDSFIDPFMYIVTLEAHIGITCSLKFLQMCLWQSCHMERDTV
jgi:hypothetical protein